MDGSQFRMVSLIGGGLLYLGLLGYSMFGSVLGGTPSRTGTTGVRAPRVVDYDDGVQVYQRRSVRSMGQRGGGIRAGK
jgi:hypothetical protein